MKKLLYIACLFVAVVASAQVAVVDPAFRDSLCSRYPGVMTAGCDSLNTGMASMLEPTLDLSFCGIDSMPEITYFRRIDTIRANNNNLTFFLEQVLPSQFWTLDRLYLNDNQIETFPRLNVSAVGNKVRYIFFQNNRATEIQQFWKLRDSLRVLNVSGNYLSDIQDLSPTPFAQRIDLSMNYFTFEDIVPQTAHPSFSTVFNVAPQRTIATGLVDTTIAENTAVEFSLPFDNNVTGSTYQWFKDGQLYATTTENKLIIDDVELTDAGEYTVRVTNGNPLLVGVELQTDTFLVDVDPCMDITGLTFDKVDKCYGAEVTFDASQVMGASGSLAYKLAYDFDTVNTEDGPFKLFIGDYQLQVMDELGCVKDYTGTVSIPGLANCDPYVITPDGDGLQDEYFFEFEGKAEVFSKVGQMVKQLDLPAFWDARDSSGSLLIPGKYVMVIEKSQHVEVKVIW